MEDKKVCEKCGVLVSKFAYNRHLKSCTGDPKKFRGGETSLKKKFVFTGVCQYCGKLCKNSNSLLSHERLCSKNENRITSFTTKGKKSWNSGLTKKDDIRIKKLGEKLSEKYKKGELKPSWLGRTHTKETKKKLSESARNNPYQRKCKSTVYYNGERFDSSWEIKLAQLLDENNIVWEKPKPLLWIDRNNKKHHYFADFYLPNYNVYLDPKNNYCFKVQKEKIDILRKTYKNILFLKEEEIDITYILLYIKYIQIFNVNG